MNNQRENATPLSRTDVLFAALTGISALALYVRTLAPSLLWGDYAEFQTLSYTLGMTHPSGYMTQIMIGKLFTLIPIGNIAWRVNLMSAFFAGLAVAEIYLIVRMLGAPRVAGIGASILLALTEGFWWRALIAESYAPAAGMLAFVWLSVLVWRKTGKPGYLFLAGLAGGLSVGIHSTVVMTSASVLAVMALTARKRADWLSASAGALLGAALTLGFFLYLDHNDPPSSVYNAVFRTNLSTLGLSPDDFDTPMERFLTIFPAGRFWTFYFTATREEAGRRLMEYFSSLPAWAVPIILLGIFSLLARGKWRDGLYPLIAFLLIWGFAITVAFSVYREFYVPVAVITSVWFGAGAGEILNLLERFLERNQAAAGMMRLVVSALLIVMPIWNSRADLILSIRSGHTSFVQRYHIYPVFAPDKAIRDARKVIRRVEEDAIVFTNWDKLYSYIYTAQIEDRETGISFHEAWIGDEQKLSESTLTYIDANIDARPIYFAIDMPGLAERYRVLKIDHTLYRIYRK